jgi:hypothetical protein|tara:strand:- start:2259 stop:2492 length:234 start_codon:yes stop_codon:yes gene_type:complete
MTSTIFQRTARHRQIGLSERIAAMDRTADSAVTELREGGELVPCRVPGIPVVGTVHCFRTGHPLRAGIREPGGERLS